MTLEEAIQKAEQPIANKNGVADSEQYAIPFELAESAKNLVGKTLRSKDPKNTNTMQVVKWVKQNYILCINGKDYSVTPVMWTLQNLNRLIVSD